MRARSACGEEHVDENRPQHRQPVIETEALNLSQLQLKDRHTKLFFFEPITELMGKELNPMKKWLSKPWETNLAHVPGRARSVPTPSWSRRSVSWGLAPGHLVVEHGA